jgi:hypothetical protein
MVMVSVLARRGGCAVIEVPVRHFPRLAGQQSLRGLAKWSRTGVRCARELVALRLATSAPPARRSARARTRRRRCSHTSPQGVTLGLVFLNLVGLALASTRLAGSYALARMVSPAAWRSSPSSASTSSGSAASPGRGR